MSAAQRELFAPLKNQSGAPVAQTSAPLMRGPPKGNGAGAKAAPHAPRYGADVARPSLTGGPQRIGALRESIRDAAAVKSRLQPMATAYAKQVREARNALVELWQAWPVKAPADIKRSRIAQYDQILDASIQWGREHAEYKRLSKLIESMADELERVLREQKT